MMHFTVCFVPVVLLSTLPVATIGLQAEGSIGPAEDTSNTTNGDHECSLRKRQDLLDQRINERDVRLTERDTNINTRLNGLTGRQNEVDVRLSKIDTRFDDLETVMSDMREYLRQRVDSMEAKAELALASVRKSGDRREVPDMRETLRQRMDSIEVKAELALAGVRQNGDRRGAASQDFRPVRASQVHKSCQEAYSKGSNSSGLYTIAPELNTRFDVYCEQELDGGGWLVFQLRKDGTIDFYRDWETYKTGFGELSGEFWLGNSYIHLLTKKQDQQLKIELTSAEGEVKYADYSNFWIEDEVQKYKLHVAGYSGRKPPGDSLAFSDGSFFCTKDMDNDATPSKSDAIVRHGAWWYQKGAFSNLNGLYTGRSYQGLRWHHWKGFRPMRATRMMIRKNV